MGINGNVNCGEIVYTNQIYVILVELFNRLQYILIKSN